MTESLTLLPRQTLRPLNLRSTIILSPSEDEAKGFDGKRKLSNGAADLTRITADYGRDVFCTSKNRTISSEDTFVTTTEHRSQSPQPLTHEVLRNRNSVRTGCAVRIFVTKSVEAN